MGMEASTAARAISAAIMMGRRRKRSTHTPASRPNSSTEAAPTAVMKPICSGWACSTMTAVYGTPSRVILDPTSEMVWPVHSFRKSRLRHRPPKRDLDLPLVIESTFT